MDAPVPPSLDEVCQQALRLPCAPTLLPRLMSALREEGGTIGDVERLIRLDSALAAATLRLVNSAYFAVREPVASLNQAIILLGQKEIYRLAAMTLNNRWEAAHHEALPWEPGDYARHSLCTALAAEVIAESSGRGDPQVAYTAGLVCDIGKLVLAFVCAGFYPRIASAARETASTWEDAERAVLGYDNTIVGSRLLRAWRFPEQFAAAVELQWRPREAPADAISLMAQLHAAKYLAVSLGPGVTEGGFLFALDGEFLTGCGFTTQFLEEAMVEVRDRAVRRLGDKLSHGILN